MTHTGLVYKVDSSKVYTIEGNTSSAAGVVSNGGAVAKKSYYRNSSYIYGYGHPKYDNSNNSNNNNNNNNNNNSNNNSNNKPSSNKIAVDGKWGPATTKKAQQVFKTTVDGIVTDQYLAYRDNNPGLISFEWLEEPGSYGSELIRAIQKKVGVTVDGYIGPKTIKAMQKWLGTEQDGYVSYPSPMVRAFQTWLNKQ